MAIHTIWLVNRAGGLIYHRTLPDCYLSGKLTGNDYLMLASTFQGVHAISTRLMGLESGGIEEVEWGHDGEALSLHCLHAPTGLKIIIIGPPSSGHDVILRKIYELYVDFALKNPFYTPDMPVRCELFDLHLVKILAT